MSFPISATRSSPTKPKRLEMPRHAKPWTLKADDILKRAIFEGWSLPAICERLGRTEAAVRARAYVLGLSFRLVSPKGKSASK
jgi:hypothetical protein